MRVIGLLGVPPQLRELVDADGRTSLSQPHPILERPRRGRRWIESHLCRIDVRMTERTQRLLNPG